MNNNYTDNYTDIIKKIIKSNTDINDLIRAAQEEIRLEEESFKRIISPFKYSDTGRQNTEKISFPAWVDETFDKILMETGLSVYEYGSGGSRSKCITKANFAKYMIYTGNDDGETLRRVLQILMSAPAWNKGYGITRFRMELVFHVLVLHRKSVDAAERELKTFLNKYDPISLKVFANADEAFRFTLDHEVQMIAFAERYVCQKIGEATEFEYAA